MYITFLDIETTGLDPIKNEIIETGAVKCLVHDGKLTIQGSAHHRVQPVYPVDPFVAKLNGYNEQDWWDASPLTTALEETFDLMRGCWHAGSNPKFDEAFMRKAAEDVHWEYPKLASYHILDVTLLAFPLLVVGDVPKLSQDTIAQYYGIESGHHSAMGDAMCCLKIFAKIHNLEITK